MNAAMDKYCSPSKSLEESLKEMKAMRQGKKKKRNWRVMMKEIKKDMDEGRL
ncbi:hypothetical protein P9265_14830 [Schinkia azotoformans]|uniref:hypothetical protein n=1 Tax=Schinkia azotoformans TaxID=1454 RepID=UPI002E1F502E|nr:hypothetical protein [Schinkia azotoformans]